MFGFALAVGIYSYLILALGLLGKLSFYPVSITTVAFWGFMLVIYFRRGIRVSQLLLKKFSFDRLSLLIISVFLVQAVVNLIGALGPELSFDALWYHLTLAKLYVVRQRVFHIPGGLLYYSSMPRLGEMLYSASLIFGSEILAKLVHWLFGILSTLALFRFLKSCLSDKFSFLGAIIFYTLLVVGWQSTTAYVDLFRVFFEIMALAYFLRWFKKREGGLQKSAFMMGLSLCVKYLSLGTFFIFIALIFLFSRKRIKDSLLFSSISLGVAFPWYHLAYFNTGNPFYPLFSGWFEAGQFGNWSNFWQTRNPITFLVSPWSMTFRLDNLLSPVFLIFLPLIVLKIRELNNLVKTVALYSFLGYIFWFFAPPSSARYLLPFTPAFIFVCLKTMELYGRTVQKIAITAVLLACILNLGSRVVATKNFLPVVLGKQTKGEFLAQSLNFNYGDFYDVDGYFKKNINDDDLVLVLNIHNLYYVDFPFVHESWVKPGTYFTHVLAKEGELPERFSKLDLLYQNEITGVKLYRFEDVYR